MAAPGRSTGPERGTHGGGIAAAGVAAYFALTNSFV
ncbi:hypothetical protein DM43_6033 [Burkholderia cepacia]|uniref:Uncharacterized protein n=1 Tax=Burkholderia cepacia TaxID=292 RepID=A0AA89CJI0_BURCE|nr:hypothetical protein DM43_6033 [Burkholderia cepacia]